MVFYWAIQQTIPESDFDILRSQSYSIILLFLLFIFTIANVSVCACSHVAREWTYQSLLAYPLILKILVFQIPF
jgi:uncharacterized integral membrane protein